MQAVEMLWRDRVDHVVVVQVGGYLTDRRQYR